MKTSPRAKAIVEFANILLDRGFSGASEAASSLKLSRKILHQLSIGQLPSNHPYLPFVARELGLTEARLQHFANGKPLAEGQRIRLTARLDSTHITNGNGKRKHTPTPAAVTDPLYKNVGQRNAALRNDEEKAKSNTLIAARLKRELTAAEMAEKVGVSSATIRNLELGQLPSNSPVLAMAAPYYHVGADELAAKMTHPAMSDRSLAGARARIANATERRAAALPRVTNGASNGAAPHPARGPRPLKKMPLELRESLRTLTNTVNMNAMKGIRETTIPTQMLAEFLRQYYETLGVEGTMILDSVFERIFD